MSKNKTPSCPTCNDTRWTSSGVCRCLDKAVSPLVKDSILRRVCRGAMTIDQDHAELARRAVELLEPCTRESHAAAIATRELFVRNTVNRRPWVCESEGINWEQGDCPKCRSTLTWDFDAAPESRSMLKSDVVAVMDRLTCLQRTVLAAGMVA